MMDDSLFLKTDIVHVDAAVIGISKARWETIQESAAEEHYAADKMKAERFDVLPIPRSESTSPPKFGTTTPLWSVERSRTEM